MSNSTVQNSASSMLEEAMITNLNFIETVNALSSMLSATTKEITVNLTNTNGESSQVRVPSFGWVTEELRRIDNNIRALSGLDETDVTLRMADGSFKKIYATQFLRSPNKIGTVDIPSTFYKSSNYLYDEWMDPMLYVGFDVSKYVDTNVQRVAIKRIILDLDTTAKVKFFNEQLNTRNDVKFESLVTYLIQNSITWREKNKIVEMPVSISRYSGFFDVIEILEATTEGNEETARRYRLSSLTYTDNLGKIKNSVILRPGDVLLAQDSKYAVDIVNLNDNTVTLRRISGSTPVSIGTDVLEIYSSLYSKKQVQVNIRPNEYQVIFFKPIIDYTETSVAATAFSPGVAFYSNNLNIDLPDGTRIPLPEYYASNVLDYAKLFSSKTFEGWIPNVDGRVPLPPTLNSSNFNVVIINDHKATDDKIKDIQRTYSQNSDLRSQIANLESEIQQVRETLNKNIFKSNAERASVVSNLTSLIDKRRSLGSLYYSQVKNVVDIVRTNETVVINQPKYRIRGFWDIPNASLDANGKYQEVVAFRYRYRYLRSDSDTAPSSKPFSIATQAGTTSTGYFSNWIEVESEARKKFYNNTTGQYEWTQEDPTNPEQININQLDIPITPDERVEFQVRSVSEAGWPDNPLLSDWSTSLIVDFPNELKKPTVSSIYEESKLEDARLTLEAQLESAGVNEHLSEVKTQNNQYFAHTSKTIDSGYRTQEGNIISLEDKLKDLENQITLLKEKIEKTKGVLKVTIVDSQNNSYVVSPKSTAKLFAGYYTELVEAREADIKKGTIISKEYTIKIENTGATPIELISRFPGGVSEPLPSYNNQTWKGLAYNDSDYLYYRRYSDVPMRVENIRAANTTMSKKLQAPPFQSMQLPGQFVYSRFTDIGLSESLYTQELTQSNNYLAPIMNGTAGTDTFIWNGTFIEDDTVDPVGGGFRSTFAVHIDHPALSGRAETDTVDTINRPDWDATTSQSVYPTWAHSKYFNLEEYEENGLKQLMYIKPVEGASDTTPANVLSAYHAKLGFRANDRYLIGRDTCGAYLFMAPKDYRGLLIEGVDNTGSLTLEVGEENTVNIPILFQARMTDYYGEGSTGTGIIGGWRPGGNNASTNPTYRKKIGLDLYTEDQTFSFDVEVWITYTRENLSNLSATTGIVTSVKNDYDIDFLNTQIP